MALDRAGRTRGATPQVSVLIPTYQGDRHIGPAIESVLAQRDVDLELIVVDDNSRDRTVEIAASYHDPRLRIVRNPANLGPEGNWNRALELASGTYVKLLPQDDILRPGCLAAQVAVLEADRDETIALVCGAREIIDGGGRVVSRRGVKGLQSGRIAGNILARMCVRKGTNVIGEPGAVLFRLSLARRIGRFDATQPYVIDLDYWIRLLGHGDGWYIQAPLCAFRVSGGSWSVAIGSQQSRQYAAFLRRMARAGLIAPSRLDLAAGRINAAILNVMRLVFYRVVIR